jgi:hypothetical protein
LANFLDMHYNASCRHECDVNARHMNSLRVPFEHSIRISALACEFLICLAFVLTENDSTLDLIGRNDEANLFQMVLGSPEKLDIDSAKRR